MIVRSFRQRWREGERMNHYSHVDKYSGQWAGRDEGWRWKSRSRG